MPSNRKGKTIMGTLPKGFGSGGLADPRESVKGCTIASCPSCKIEFYQDENHKICNMCSVGMVWNIKKQCYTYYPGLDKSKQSKVDV